MTISVFVNFQIVEAIFPSCISGIPNKSSSLLKNLRQPSRFLICYWVLSLAEPVFLGCRQSLPQAVLSTD